MKVVRGDDSRVKPPLNFRWPKHVKLEWLAALVAYDTGLDVWVEPVPADSGLARLFSRMRYTLRVAVGSRQMSLGSFSYREAWETLWVFREGASAVMAAVCQYADELKRDAYLSYMAAGESPPQQLDYSEGHYAGCLRTKDEIAKQLHERFGPPA